MMTETQRKALRKLAKEMRKHQKVINKRYETMLEKIREIFIEMEETETDHVNLKYGNFEVSIRRKT